MKARKSWIVAIVILIAGIAGSIYLSGLKKPPIRKVSQKSILALTIGVTNTDLPLIIEGSGQMRAKNRIDIFAEVNGILIPASKDFRAGRTYDKNEILISIDDKEFRANLMAQRSEFQSLITSILPDIKLEFPNEKQKWDNYLNSIVVDGPIPQLPETVTKKEKFFITGRKVYTTYYNLKNLEARLDKYTLRAPFNGIVTESNINPGGLVRSGQKLGIYSNTGVYELELSVPESEAGLIKIGDKAEIFSHDNNDIWEGIVSRINSAINLNTQTVSVFIETSGKGIKEGMFPNARIYSGTISDVFAIPRNLIFDNNWIYYICDDSTLQKTQIVPVRFLEKTVIVKDLPNGMRVLEKNIPGSFIGLKVIPISTTLEN
ncbi:MAG: HlyD family efflux transporter periplasmic adaptor subunit [Bacteroidetes bacterium]|nr:HlyD family efflux transporter periplasmic adaptor subunit [Bacteroidota bacterium]